MKRKDRSIGNSERERAITQFQKTLGEIVVLLLEIKNASGITLSTKAEIGRCVEELQSMIRELPVITNSQSVLKMVFKTIRTIVPMWRSLSGD